MKNFPITLAAIVLFAASASAQTVPRVKAKILSFDGQILVLDTSAALKPAPDGRAARTAVRSASAKAGAAAAPAAAAAQTPPTGKDDRLSVALLPATLLVSDRASVRGAIKVGDFLGVEVTTGQGGRLTAGKVYIYPDALRGANEGRFADGDTTRLGGFVTGIGPDTVTLHYRGRGEDGGVCAGRAVSTSVSPKACTGDVTFGLDGETPVGLLVVGDRKLLTPGAIATVSLVRVAGGGMASPGIIVEKPQ